MTDQTSTAPALSSVSPRTLRWGGTGLLIAGALQLVAVIPFLLPATPKWITPLWQIGGWLLGAVILLTASITLTFGRRGQDGIAGRSPLGRTALLVFGASGLLNVAVILLALTFGDTGPGPGIAILLTEQLIVFAATAAAATAVARARVVTGYAKWGLVLIAALDAVDTALLLITSTGPAFTAGVYVIRPALLTVTGLAYSLRSRARSRE